MPQPQGKKKNVKRLAKGLPKAGRGKNANPEGKSKVGDGPGSNPAGAIGDARSVTPLSRLLQSLGEEKIRFQIVGMTAAVVQGVIVTTIDTDIWVDLPERQYIRLLNLCVKLGATPLAPTLYALSDGKLVNFLFRVTGIKSFSTEYKSAESAVIEGQRVKVLPLKRILASKKAVQRDKDKTHILQIEQFMTAKKALERKKQK